MKIIIIFPMFCKRFFYEVLKHNYFYLSTSIYPLMPTAKHLPVPIILWFVEQFCRIIDYYHKSIVPPPPNNQIRLKKYIDNFTDYNRLMGYNRYYCASFNIYCIDVIDLIDIIDRTIDTQILFLPRNYNLRLIDYLPPIIRQHYFRERAVKSKIK